jgi:hypothetical protein
MLMTVLKIDKKPSRYGGDFYYLFCKGENGHSFRTCLYPNFGNFCRCGWDRIIAKGTGAMFEVNVNIKGFIDADCVPKIREVILSST